MKRNESDEKSKKSKKRSRKSEAEQAKKKWKRSYYTPDCSKEDVRAHQTLKAEFRINPHFNAGESRDSVIMLVKKLIAGDKECVARMKKLEQLGEDHGVDFFRDGIFAGGLVSTLLEEGADLKDKMLGLGMFHFPPDTVNPKQGSLEVSEDRKGWKNQTMNHLFKTILLWYLWVLENKEQVTLTAAEKAAFFDYFLGIDRLPAMFEAGIIKQAGKRWVHKSTRRCALQAWTQMSGSLSRGSGQVSLIPLSTSFFTRWRVAAERYLVSMQGTVPRNGELDLLMTDMPSRTRLPTSTAIQRNRQEDSSIF